MVLCGRGFRWRTIVFIGVLKLCSFGVEAGYEEIKREMSWVHTQAEDFWDDESSYASTESGLRYKLLPPRRRRVHMATTREGDHVSILYKLYLLDGHTHVYSQSNMGEAFSHVAGSGGVIKGFDEAVLLMKHGDRGRFVLPPQIGYGTKGAKDFHIPPGATLEYFMELRHTGGYEEL